jgi:succinate dehydrogenase/fumarate reductase flavoprotein subunit
MSCESKARGEAATSERHSASHGGRLEGGIWVGTIAQETWDIETDVVVAGYGFAGGWAAISAHDAGAEVLLLEKMHHFGGNSILSGGGCSCGTDYEQTLAYLEATSAGSTDIEVLKVYAQEMCSLASVMEDFAEEVGFSTIELRGGGSYPFPGADQFRVVRFTRNESYAGFPWAKGVTSGGTHFWILNEHVNRRNIPQLYDCAVTRLITDDDGAIVGVNARREGQDISIHCRKGVILCTGGFEHNAQMISHYLELRECAAMSPLGNTGDGVAMAQKVGAALWHMWHVHGSYGFKIPDVPVAIRTPFGGYRNDPSRPAENRRMPWIAVDRFGSRFMNEWPRACADTPIRELARYDFDLLDYRNVPCYLVFDDVGRQLGPIGSPKFNDESLKFEWSSDNLTEVASGHILRRESIQELATALGCAPGTLAESVAVWNEACRLGVDTYYGRTTDSMLPISTPPFYGIRAWPIISNTQGGPAHDSCQRVIDAFGDPIEGLYVAGELGSIWGHVYLLSGNVLECIIGGRIAGREIASRK